MTYVDKLRSARNTVQDCYMQYNEIRRKRPDAFIAFLEGYDAPYYLPFIESIIGTHPEQVICHNKANVISVYDSLLSKKLLKKAKTGFFVDRDFDINTMRIKDIQQFYVTGGYSVENYYCTRTALERILKDYMHYNCAHKDYDVLVENYLTLQHQFNLAIVDFNAYYCSLKRNNIKVGWSLCESVPSQYVAVDFTNYTVVKGYNWETIRHNYPAKPVPSADDVKHNALWIMKNVVMNVRGKYEFSFLIKFLQSLPKVVNDPASGFENHPMNFSMGYADALSALAQYADKDDGLASYIRRRVA